MDAFVSKNDKNFAYKQIKSQQCRSNKPHVVNVCPVFGKKYKYPIYLVFCGLPKFSFDLNCVSSNSRFKFEIKEFEIKEFEIKEFEKTGLK